MQLCKIRSIFQIELRKNSNGMMLCPSSYFFGNERDKKCMNEIAAILRSKGICANPYVCTFDMKMCTVTQIKTVLSKT